MQMKTRRHSRRRAFTLIEMMVVLAIIAALAAVAGPAIFKYLKDADLKAAKMQVQNLSSAVKGYYMDVHEYPKRLEDLVTDTGNAKWKGPYLEGRTTMPKDPWGKDYQYQNPGSHNKNGVDIYSEGPEGAAGPIGNWEE